MRASRGAPWRILVAAGGTGGHLYPALAVVESLRARAEIDVVFFGTRRGIEARVLPAAGEKLEFADVRALNGVRGVKLVGALARLPVAAWQCAEVLHRVSPSMVLSAGGYTSGPISAMALARGIPVAVIEPNAIAGLANRALGRWVSRAYVTHEEAAPYFRSDAVRTLGSPVRRAFVEAAHRGIDRRTEIPHVLVIGGSQGARAINDVMPGAVERARREGSRFTLMHQTGASDRERVAEAYAARGIEAEVTAFIDDVAGAMGRADLVVCRAGAGTVAELAVIGRAALFIPLPTAADDHQTKNARAVEARGAGAWMEQSAASESGLGARLRELVGDAVRLRTMALRAREMGTPEAAGRIAEDVVALLNGH